MKTKLLLSIITGSLIGSEPLPDIVKLEGLSDIPSEHTITHKIEVPAETAAQLTRLGHAASEMVKELNNRPPKLTITHKIEVPADTTTQLMSLGCAASGLAIIGMHMITNGSKEEKNNWLPLVVGGTLCLAGYALSKYNKQGTADEPTKKDQALSDNAISSDLLTGNLSS